MKRRKFLLGSSAALASVGFVSGTGAFSSAEVERGVKIEVVSDENGYLGLKEDGGNDGDLLFGFDRPRIESERFTVRNQTNSSVSITIILQNENFRFTSPNPGDDDQSLHRELQPGEDIPNVTISLVETLYSSDVQEGTILFQVDGEGLHIEAERTLRLEPEEIEADVQLANINAPIKIKNVADPDIDTVEVAGQEVDTTSQGNNVFLDFDDRSEVGCDSPDDTTTVSVSGTAGNGRQFSGTAEGVNCSNGNPNSNESDSDTNESDSETDQ